VTLSLRARLFLVYLAVAAITLGLGLVLAGRVERQWVEARAGDELERVARLAARELMDPSSAGTDAADQADALGKALGLRVTLMDRSGRVLGDSQVRRARLPQVENHARRPEMMSALAGGAGRAVRHSATIGIDLMYVAVPVPGGRGVAVLRVARPLAEVGLLARSLTRVSVVPLAVALAMMLGLTYWLAGRQAARVAELERVAERIGAGGTARAGTTPADEVGRLGGALNRMADELGVRLSALEAERDARERILAHMSDGVALVDATGHVVYANRSLAAILGAAMPPQPGTSFLDFARPPELAELLDEARTGDRTVERELDLWTPHPRRVRATATRLGATGSGVVLVLHDLTEIELLNRVRQDFVANVSHELKTPLTSVRGYAETLLDGGLDDSDHREDFVRVIRDQATRLEVLVNDLLSLAELERPDTRLRREPYDLREALAQQVAAGEPRARTAGLTLELLPGEPEPVVADRTRLDQVIANLLDNALKYTERGGVRVRLHGDGAIVACEVTDSGPGIPVADQPRIFERFYRVDKARSREKGGTGLGLAIVKHIVLLHGGTVSVESAAGGGSTFRFEIPRRPPA
jgi:two-component system, OmpR family, phosphate regulon sensor histidine kinase PhoR